MFFCGPQSKSGSTCSQARTLRSASQCEACAKEKHCDIPLEDSLHIKMQTKWLHLLSLILCTACTTVAKMDTAIEATTTKAPTATVNSDDLGITQRAPPPTQTQGDGVPPACGYAWGSKPLPELTQQWQEAITNMQVNSLNTYAQAYGENCIDAKGNVMGFSPMRTEFYTTILIDNHVDAEAMSGLVKQVFAALETIPPQKRAGAEYIAYISFKADEWKRSTWFTIHSIKDALERGLTGEEFLASLEHW